MSGLDDSLSDIAGKKKYPFELEKAIHNVMFIQHHMQRQDEFNAVSFEAFFFLLFQVVIFYGDFHKLSNSDVCTMLSVRLDFGWDFHRSEKRKTFGGGYKIVR